MIMEPGKPYDLVDGDPGSAVILHVPHASRELTWESWEMLLIGDDELDEELDHLTDAYTDVIAATAADRSALRPWIFRNRWSRLVVDPERFPDEREAMRTAGMGAVYTHGYAGRRIRDDDAGAETALDNHFHPYAAGMTELVADRLATVGRAVVIDVHSYSSARLPYEMGGSERPPVCLGTDDFHTPPELVAAARDAFGPVALNSPFAGCYVPLRFYGTEPAVTALMIEIRRDGYMAEPGGQPTDGLPLLASKLAALVDAIS